MKYELPTVLDALDGGRIENRIQTHSIWRQSRRRRQIPPGLGRMFVGINDRMESRWHPVWSEGVPMTCFRHVAMMSRQLTRGEYRMPCGTGSPLGHSLRSFCAMRRLINGETSVCQAVGPKIGGMIATHLSIGGWSYMQSMRVARYFTSLRCL